MVIHTCQICYKEFSKKSAYNSHMSRKVKCEPFDTFINNESSSSSSSNSRNSRNSLNLIRLENKYIKKLENRIQELESDMRYVLNVLSSKTSPIRFDPFNPPYSLPSSAPVNHTNIPPIILPPIYDFDKIGSHSLNKE